MFLKAYLANIEKGGPWHPTQLVVALRNLVQIENAAQGNFLNGLGHLLQEEWKTTLEGFQGADGSKPHNLLVPNPGPPKHPNTFVDSTNIAIPFDQAIQHGINMVTESMHSGTAMSWLLNDYLSVGYGYCFRCLNMRLMLLRLTHKVVYDKQKSYWNPSSEWATAYKHLTPYQDPSANLWLYVGGVCGSCEVSCDCGASFTSMLSPAEVKSWQSLGDCCPKCVLQMLTTIKPPVLLRPGKDGLADARRLRESLRGGGLYAR